MELVPVLRRINIFEDLDDATLRRVAERFVTRTHPEGTLLFTAGEEARGLYVILEGRVRIFRTSPEGREQIIHMEVPGRPVAELPLFDGGPYPASAMTSEHSRLAFLPRAEILTFEEIERVVRASVALGVRKVRLTGGEPLVRRHLETLVGMLAPHHGSALRSHLAVPRDIVAAR